MFNKKAGHPPRSLRAFVIRFDKGENSPTYHVYVTQMFTLKEALATRDALLASKVTREAAVTQIPGQLPDGTSGWVALSPPSKDKDPYFNLSNGEPIKLPLRANTLIKAVIDVNLRPNPADWNKVIGVIDIGRCFQVEETRTVDAKQVWARGNVKDCS
jgi:hypothetical protein